MRKGASLPIETTVILVLAVVVLATLLFMFFGVAKDPTATNELKRTSACRTYTAQNPKCDAPGSDQDALTKIGDACKGLGGYPKCTGGAADLACILQCCRTFCPGSTGCGDDFGDTKIADCVYEQCDTPRNQKMCWQRWRKPNGDTCDKVGDQSTGPCSPSP